MITIGNGDSAHTMSVMDSSVRTVDQAALAGIGVVGTISIANAEGPYTPFDSVIGIVLLMLFVSFRRPSRGPYVVSAAIYAVLVSLILSPLTELVWQAKPEYDHDILVDSVLAAVWFVLFWLILGWHFWNVGRTRRARPAGAAEPAESPEPGVPGDPGAGDGIG